MDLRVGFPKIRVLPTPEEKLRSLTQGADHAEAWAQKVRMTAEPVLGKLYAVRRRLATTAVAVLAIWLFVHIMFGANGIDVYRTKHSEYRSLQKEIERIEKEAREQFHYARPGEVVYVSPEPAAPLQPVTHSANK